MAWIETLTKEAFHAAIREAMKPQINEISNRIDKMSDRLQAIDQMSDRLQSFEQRLSRLEGVVEGSTKANEANIRAYESAMRSLFFEFKADFLQRQLDQKGA